ncbi:hypothetical protein ACMD2_18772 [Ananas comosus]|uniref:Uncharacterized protein n=1 Tax=Ananas comosus TaxID=4615 RepID=A0A199VUQ0_ANACO|nr:hypothetical protein ACMD2_18772 [Ananas comosus]
MAFEAFLNSLEHGVGGGGDVLTKVGVFVLVQALVYLILTKSSNIFSSCSSSSSSSSVLRSLSFRPVRMSSVRRVLASLSDVPAGSDDPSSANLSD